LGTPITLRSEIRGVFIFEGIYGVPHDWNVIAENLASYGINAVFVNDFSTFQRRPDSEIRMAIDAFHNHGIEYHSVMSVLQDTKPPGETSYGTEAITYKGEVYSRYSHCPIKAHDYVISSIENYLRDFPDIDGIMMDFIRYAADIEDPTCYCEYCRAAFEEWLGEKITDWSLFYPSGARFNDFLEFRPIPINDLVKDIHNTIKEANQNIVISEAAWTLFSDCPIYWRKFIGQDTAYWIKEGYIDFVAPMMYTKELADLENYINTNIKYWMGGQPEGPIPLVGLLRNDYGSESPTPEEFKAEVDLVRQKGLDGWIIWRYSGPGGELPDSPDITSYLSIIDMPETFTITNIKTSDVPQGKVVSWNTDLPATSRVEHSTSPLFSSSWEVWKGEFHYWNIKRGSIESIEDPTLKTAHSINIPTNVYFRIQSKGSGGIATTPIYYATAPTPISPLALLGGVALIGGLLYLASRGRG